jgi:hypothetical protein
VKTAPLFAEDLLKLADQVTRAGGLLTFRSRGHSMAPFIHDGDRVVLGPNRPQGPRVGEVVLVRTARGPRLHRLTGSGHDQAGGSFSVTGDANGSLLEIVRREDVIATVVSVHRPLRRYLSPGFLRSWLGQALGSALRWIAGP